MLIRKGDERAFTQPGRYLNASESEVCQPGTINGGWWTRMRER
ncbi:hypothetical protein [Streptomyces sp. IMTB 1903]|nr:hypothetical protein [Streptomyces sp. IMTB 1903]